jgi:hypothetical protein
MTYWQDTLTRVVDFDTLRRMCEAASGIAHSYTVEAGRTRVRLEYTNPDEYGRARPYVAFLPCWQESGRVMVALTVTRDYGAENEHGRESCWQNVDAEILSAPAIRPDGTRDGKPPMLSHFAAETLRAAADLCRALESLPPDDARRVAARDVLQRCNILLEG